MAVGDLSFAFNPAAGETPQTIAAKRALALAIMGNTSHAPRDIGEGLNSIGQAIMYRNLMKGVNTAETEGQSGAAKIMQSLFGGGAENQFPPAPSAPSAGGGSVSSAAPASSPSNVAGNAPDLSGNDIYSGFMDTVKGSITNPNALAAVAATGTAESQFSPKRVFSSWSDPSESGQAGTSGGIMSWRGPRFQAMRDFAAANGGDPNKPSPQLQAQFFLQEDPTLIAKLNAAKNPAEAQQLMNNAWKFAGYDRPGGEAARRIALANNFAGQFAGQSPTDVASVALPQMAPLPTANPAAGAPVQVASLDPSAGMVAPASKPLPPEFASKGITQEQWDAMNAPDGAPQAPAQAAPAPVPDAMAAAQQAVSPSPLPDAQFNARFGGPMPAGPVPQPPMAPQAVDPKSAIANAMAGSAPNATVDAGFVPGAPGAVSPAGQRVLATMMQQQPMSGGSAPLPLQDSPQASNGAPAGLPPSAPMGTIAKAADGQVYQYAETTGMAGASGPAGWIRRNGAEPTAAMAQAAPPLPPPTTIQDRPVAANNGPDPSTLPAMAGGTADVVQPGSGRQGLSPQQLIEAAGNPWVMQRYGPIVDAMISQQMTPHKLDMVPLGNGVIAQVDSVTGRIVGQLKGQPDLKTLKDAAGNEYLVNPADPSHPISVDSIAAGAGGQGQTANGQPDPYASPFPRTMPRTEDMKGYEAYLAQARASGTPADQLKPFQQYQMDLRKMGQPTVNIEGETEYAKGLGKAMADKTNSIIDAGQQAPNKLATYQLMKEMMPNIYTGTGGDKVLEAKKIAKSLGIDVGDVSDAEFVRAMGNQMALELRNPAGGAGMPGAMSDADRAFLASMSPGLSTTPEGNQKLLDYRMAIEKRNIDVAQRANEYMNAHNGRLDNNFFADLSKWSAENPLFPKGEESKAVPGGKKPTVIDGYTIEEVQ